MKSNNAPSDWNPTGAAQVSASDSTTLADDLRFALRAMGLREEFAGMGPGEFALALFGGAMVTLGCLLLCLGA